MQLPGGLWEGRKTCRDFAFKPPDGELELTVAEAGLSGASLPAQVTAVLAAGLGRLGAEPVTRERAAALCIADRQFLMRQLAALLGSDQVWQSARCDRCDAVFDVPVTQTLLPVSKPGPGFPFASVRLGKTTVRLRVPNGADQEAIAGIASQRLARQRLAWCCIVEEEGEGKPDPASLDDQTLQDMETALEGVAPEAAVVVQTACPECGHASQVDVAPYRVLQTTVNELYDEIHALAITYHWDEATILALPRTRRRRYLDLIDRARGMTG